MCHKRRKNKKQKKIKKLFQNTCTLFVNKFRIFNSKLMKAFQKSFSETTLYDCQKEKYTKIIKFDIHKGSL